MTTNARFEVGKIYESANPCCEHFGVVKRTNKTITATNGYGNWRMKIRVDDSGDEYVKRIEVYSARLVVNA